MSEPLSVLIADDHELFRLGTRSLIESLDDFECVGETATGAETIDFLKAHDVDLLLLDYNMPDGDGLSVIQALLNNRNGNISIVLLTAIDSPLVLSAAIEAGVSAVVTKRGSGEQLLQAMSAVRDQQQFVTPQAQQILDRAVELEQLTKRETQVMLSLLSGKDTQGVADSLSISFKTAETHKTRVMAKLKVHSTQGLLEKAQQLGLMNPGT